MTENGQWQKETKDEEMKEPDGCAKGRADGKVDKEINEETVHGRIDRKTHGESAPVAPEWGYWRVYMLIHMCVAKWY